MCKGTLSLEVYGESRKEIVPIESEEGIGLPLKVNSDGDVVPLIMQVYFKAKGQDLERVIEFELNREDQVIDLCESI